MRISITPSSTLECRGLHGITTGTITVVDLSIAEGKLVWYVRGADKPRAFKSSLEIPLVHIASVRADPAGITA
jgi:hypothetical protein